MSMATSLHVTGGPSSGRKEFAPPAIRNIALRCRQSRSVQAQAALLEVRDLRAKIVATGSEVLKGVNFSIEEGQIAAVMGKNGCGKSTLSKVLVGHPDYEVTSGTVMYKGENLLELEPEERARAGIFLSFQAPIEVPGVNNVDFLRMAANARRKAQGKDEFEPLDFYMHLQPKLESMKMDPSFLSRNVNEGFSGGEKKRNEILQLAVLEPDVAILDEIDSGLDVDALKDVSSAVNGMRSDENCLIMITHYKRLLEYIRPDSVHIMSDGAIVRSGGFELVEQVEVEGFATVTA